MKGFDRWWEDNWWELEDGGNEFNTANVAWRAALKEILSQLERPIYSADIMKWIRKELDG